MHARRPSLYNTEKATDQVKCAGARGNIRILGMGLAKWLAKCKVIKLWFHASTRNNELQVWCNDCWDRLRLGGLCLAPWSQASTSA
eukprot:1053766-Amphidinium_carterae.1